MAEEHTGFEATGNIDMTTHSKELILRVKTTAGAPAETPADGAIVINTNENAIYIRSGGAWVQIT